MRSGMIIHPDEITHAWIDKLADAGIHTLGIHSVGGKLAHQELADLVTLAKQQSYRDRIDYARSRGLEIEYELHAAGYLMPRSLFSQHPEYFRMNRDGQRCDDFNFCVTNPEALELFTDRAVKLAQDLYGSSQNFYFWLDDGWDIACHCPNCRKYSPSDQQALVLNAMLKKIRKVIPDARMAYLAYMDCLVPPATVEPDENIFLEYAPFEKYTAKGPDAPERIARERELLKPLIRFFRDRPLKVLEYWYDNSLFSQWTKPPKPFTLKEPEMIADIQEYRDMGFSWITTFACFLGYDYIDLYGDVEVTPFQNALCLAQHIEPLATQNQKGESV